QRAYGTDIISSAMESAYNCIFLLAKAMQDIKKIDTASLSQALPGLSFAAPQGTIRVDEKNHHFWLKSRIGRANEKGQFDILWESDEPVAPVPFFMQLFSAPSHERYRVVTNYELEKKLKQYETLIEQFRKAVRLFPHVFAFFDTEGVLLELWDNKLEDSKDALQLQPGVYWTSPPFKESGISLAITGHMTAVTRGNEHKYPELMEWISIGIPVKGNTGTLQGVLGVFLEANNTTLDIDIGGLISFFTQIVECSLEIVDKSSTETDKGRLLSDITSFLPESLFVLKGNEVVFTNEMGQQLLTKYDFIRTVLKDLNGQSSLDKEMFLRRRIADLIFELRVLISEPYFYVYMKQYSNEAAHILFKDKRNIETKDIIGSNERFLRAVNLAKSAAKMNANVLILGESGTGKELFARAIHNESARRNKPFVALNCAAIPRDLINAELFGYVDGAFTGAKKGGSPGKFEVANGGTLFLDEIGDMPLELQSTLLRVLQEREVVRVGGYEPIPIDVRIIAATNTNIFEEIAYKGSFRGDLYYRLNVFTIEVIPLRERIDDIPELVENFLAELNATSGSLPKVIEEGAIKILSKHNWPGNVRELRNVVERAFYVAENSPVITIRHLPDYVMYQYDVTLSKSYTPAFKIKSLGEPKERRYLVETLAQFRGNISKTAKHLGISRTTLYNKIKEYHLK
ncbi:MAG: sigma-54 interaction domain-containing protein, partial [Desulfitobacteriaceae bacterium]